MTYLWEQNTTGVKFNAQLTEALALLKKIPKDFDLSQTDAELLNSAIFKLDSLLED